MTIESIKRLETLIKEIDMLPAAVVKLRGEIAELKAKCAQVEDSISKVEKEIELKGKEQGQYLPLIDKMNKLLGDIPSMASGEWAGLANLSSKGVEPLSGALDEEGSRLAEVDGPDARSERYEASPAQLAPQEGEDSPREGDEPSASRGMVGQVEEITHVFHTPDYAEVDETVRMESFLDDFENPQFEKDFDLAKALQQYTKRKRKGSFWRKMLSGKKKKTE